MTRVAFIVSGDEQSPMAHRARAFATLLRERFDIHTIYRDRNKLLAVFKFWSSLRRVRPDVAYVFDISYSAVFGAWLHLTFARNVLIIETGDAIYELMRSSGNRGRVGLWLTRWLEKFSLRTADRIVVRGTFHQQLLRQQGINADVIQDGVDVTEFAAQTSDDLRARHGLNGELTVGLVGSSIWSEKLQMCYGWDLIETIRLLNDQPVKGIMIGDGSGIAQLKALCREYGIEQKVIFVGRVDYEQLPNYLGMIDVCLSTQTNDVVGQVRTTGKLPLYLASGRYVLASDVGEAKLVLDAEMLVPYEGVTDPEYPQRLKEKIEVLLDHREDLKRSLKNVEVARQRFDYAVLAPKMRRVVEQSLTKNESNQGAGSV
jgi:glycosyltransferase involved in cell wall biosynthesis